MKSFEVLSLSLKEIELDDLKSLFRVCDWDWLEPDSAMLAALAGTFKMYVVKSGGHMVGFARIVSDGKIYGLLVDCMVSPEFRRRGIGRRLVDHVIRDCRTQGLKVIQLLASSDGVHLYKQAGFTQCSESSPGMIKFLFGPQAGAAE